MHGRNLSTYGVGLTLKTYVGRFHERQGAPFVGETPPRRDIEYGNVSPLFTHLNL